MNVITTVALALTLAQTPAQAQDQATTQQPPSAVQPVPPEPSAGPVVSLDQALEAAGQRNLDLRALGAQLDQAAEITWKALSLYLPQVTASARYARQDEVRSDVVFGLPGTETTKLPNGAQLYSQFAQLPIEEQKNGLFGVQVNATQMLISPQIYFAIGGAKSTQRAAILSLENGRRQVLFGVARAYYATAALKQGVEVTQRLLEIARRQEHDAQVRYQAGAIAKVGLIRAEIDRARAEQDLKRQRNSYLSAKASLASLLDRDTAFEVESPPEPALPALEAEPLAKQAVESRPDVQAARITADAERQNKTSAWSRYLPNLQAFATYQRANQRGLNQKYDSWVYGLQAQWTILDGLRRESDIREASARVAEAQARAEGAAARARTEVEQALLDLDSARANALKAKEQRDLATENLRLVDVAYRAGTATAVEQADATAQLRTAEIGFTNETLNAQLAALNVLNVTGAFNPRKP
jgi:outer membrane protein TolC